MDLKLNIYKDKKGIFYGGVEEQKADLFTIADAIDANSESITEVSENVSILEKVTSEEVEALKVKLANTKITAVIALIIAAIALIASLV